MQFCATSCTRQPVMWQRSSCAPSGPQAWRDPFSVQEKLLPALQLGAAAHALTVCLWRLYMRGHMCLYRAPQSALPAHDSLQAAGWRLTCSGSAVNDDGDSCAWCVTPLGCCAHTGVAVHAAVLDMLGVAALHTCEKTGAEHACTVRSHHPPPTRMQALLHAPTYEHRRGCTCGHCQKRKAICLPRHCMRCCAGQHSKPAVSQLAWLGVPENLAQL
jgi:hypothetical protein